MVRQGVKARRAVRELLCVGLSELTGVKEGRGYRAVELEERRAEGCSVTQCEGLQPECGKEGEALLQSQEQHPAGIRWQPRSGEAALTHWAPWDLGSSSKPQEQDLRPSCQISKEARHLGTTRAAGGCSVGQSRA